MESMGRIYRNIAILFLLLLLAPGPAGALDVRLLTEDPGAMQQESALVDINFELSGLPKQARYIELETDLIPNKEQALWNVSNDELWDISGETDDMKASHLVLEVSQDWYQPVVINLRGKVPVFTETTQYEGIVITKFPARRTGYTYLRIQALDDEGFPVGSAVTETFDLVIPEEVLFEERLNQVEDPNLRVLISGFYDKGLTGEADELLMFVESPKEPIVPLWLTIVLILIGIVCAFFAGQVRGMIVERKKRDLRGEL